MNGEQPRQRIGNGQGNGGGIVGGFGGLGGFAGFGRGNQQPLDSMGRPRQVTLTIAADDQTNTLIGTATGEMIENIHQIVEFLEDNAKNSTKVVTLVGTIGEIKADANVVLAAKSGDEGEKGTIEYTGDGTAATFMTGSQP